MIWYRPLREWSRLWLHNLPLDIGLKTTPASQDFSLLSILLLPLFAPEGQLCLRWALTSCTLALPSYDLISVTSLPDCGSDSF